MIVSFETRSTGRLFVHYVAALKGNGALPVAAPSTSEPSPSSEKGAINFELMLREQKLRNSAKTREKLVKCLQDQIAQDKLCLKLMERRVKSVRPLLLVLRNRNPFAL